MLVPVCLIYSALDQDKVNSRDCSGTNVQSDQFVPLN